MSLSLRKNGPIFLISVFALIVISPGVQNLAIPKKDAFATFGLLPVLHNGRLKPWDSFARETLLSLRGKQSVKTAETGKKWSAIQWLTTVFFESDTANRIEVFRVDHADLKTMLHAENEQKKYFSYNDLTPYLSTIDTQARLSNPEPENRDAFQKEVVSLHAKLITYQSLLCTFHPILSTSDRLDSYQRFLDSFMEQDTEESSLPTPIPEAIKVEFSGQSADNVLRFVPSENNSSDWYSLTESWMEAQENPLHLSTLRTYLKIAARWEMANRDEVVDELRGLRYRIADSLASTSVRKVLIEAKFNSIQPFILSIELYLLTFLVVILGWIVISRQTLTAAFWLTLVSFLIHTLGMLVRMWLMGRPPVTNLYSSAIFVGWGTVGLGLLLEWLFKNGVGSAMAAVTGLLSLIIAQHLMEMGDTMGMMRAVLDSNFWLTTHVITVTFGYSATFVAGFLAIAYLILGIFTPRLTPELQTTLNRMVYGTVCFALFFSFIGTFLGGIWADQSWGRFWGWDPKENGALLIVVWNAVILHARQSKQIGSIGMMQCAIFGNMVTAWSWFGTNMLGQGLHSYGFMESAMWWLFLFWISQLLLIVMGRFPTHKWRSFQNSEVDLQNP